LGSESASRSGTRGILLQRTIDDALRQGWGDRVGSIEKGKYADLIAVSGNYRRQSRERGHGTRGLLARFEL
jgi:predicted amidohydrolase YtcJ